MKIKSQIKLPLKHYALTKPQIYSDIILTILNYLVSLYYVSSIFIDYLNTSLYLYQCHEPKYMDTIIDGNIKIKISDSRVPNPLGMWSPINFL